MVVTARVIEKLKNKDEQTFDQIYYEYNDLIYYICYSFTHDKSVSEDLMQETFIKMFLIFKMVSARRLERQTDRLEGDCSIQLSYADIIPLTNKIII